VLVFTMLAGCGTNSPNPNNNSGQANATSTPADGNSKEFTLKVIGTNNADDGIDVAEELYKKIYPNAKVEYITGAWGSGGKHLRDKQLIMISSGEFPDVGKMAWGKEFFKAGVIDDLTDEIKNFEIYPKLSKGQLERMTYNGKIFGITYNNNCIFLMYNKDILSRVGVTEPPKTLDEVETIAKKIKDADLKAENGKPIYTVNYEGGCWQMDFWLWANGGKQMNDDYTKTLIDSPESIKAYKIMQDYINKGYAPKPDGSYDQLWLNGQLAFWTCGEWELQATKDAKINAGYTVMPKGSSGENTVSIGGVEWAIFKGTKHRKEAIDFLKVLVSQEMHLKFDRAMTDISMYDNPEKQAIWKKDGVLDAKLAQKQQLASTKFNFLENPFSFADAANIYQDAYDKILVRGDDVEATMKKAAEEINKGLAEAGK